ncbi:MAG: tRNA dihydrouridine synthase DusB [Bdellovibrionaceae bacterium]|nr:tRNA dihydrouridine synthase DusB [Pseudobdellovibrionaceae bacterium]|tara:strand:+ start:7903 stop:8871 length:969 start_codon:yes stop_codon:yes gene_type:complete
MAGITNSPFRRLMRKRGSALVISELVSANGIEYASQRTLDLLHFEEDERVIGLQIFGESTENLVKSCQLIEKKGADFVDLNLGCPVPKVVKKGAGSAMCKDPVSLGKTLSAMVSSVSIPVTIKIRIGWDSESVNAHEIVKVAEDAGVAWVAIHGRTRAQGYSGLADWDYLGEVKAKSSLPIIGNGDITTPESAVHKLKTYGVDAVMIGRGALRNPFIFEQANEVLKGNSYNDPTGDDYLSLLKIQKKYLLEQFHENKAMLHVKKFLAWYSAGYPGGAEFRRFVFQTKDSEQVWEGAHSFFLDHTRRRNTSFLREPFLMGGHG